MCQCRSPKEVWYFGEGMTQLTIFLLNGVILLRRQKIKSRIEHFVFAENCTVVYWLWIFSSRRIFQYATEDRFDATPAGIIIIGAFMLVMAIVGILGIIRKSKFMNGVYASGLLIILLAQITVLVPPVRSFVHIYFISDRTLQSTFYLDSGEWATFAFYWK